MTDRGPTATIRIGRLVLADGGPRNGHRVRMALQRQLVRLVERGGLPDGIEDRTGPLAIDVGADHRGAGTAFSDDALGIAIADRLYEGLGG